ncbi:MAG: DNA-processing protein DprA [Longimicrobiales bacterium]
MDPLTGTGVGERRRRELEALLILDALPGMGPRSVREVVGTAGSAQAALADARLLEARAGAAAVTAARAAETRDGVLRALERADRMAMATVLFSEPAYPPALLHLSDPPPVLFLRGRAELLSEAGIAVVGARRATARARGVAHALGAAVAARGTPVVSGLALGVDGAAHEGALHAAGPTVAVMGCGADRAYPATHAVLFRRILRDGLVVSEFPPGTPALPYHFPRRNRILAALSRALVVVEAGERSGALISVDHALDLGVEVWAVPGPVDEPACLGSNALLADGARPLVSVARFVEAVLGAAPAPAVDAPAAPPGPEGDVLSALDEGTLSADELVRATGLPSGKVLALLSALELRGRVRRLPGMRFRRAG